jgi:hypothetical protein
MSSKIQKTEPNNSNGTPSAPHNSANTSNTTLHNTGSSGIPPTSLVVPLLDLCLLTVCKHLDGCEYLNVLPDFIRKRLGILFKQEASFQNEITTLNLSHCYSFMDDEVKPLSYLKNLTSLNLSHCEQLTGIALSYIGQLPKLQTLILNHCTKISLGFYFLQKVTTLTKLEVSFCEIQDPVMPLICDFKNLEHLNLMCNRLTDEGCALLSNLTNLKSLTLSMNPLITDKTLEALTDLHNLTSLNLNFCKQISSDGIERLSKSIGNNLKQIDMVGCDRALTDGMFLF